MSTRPSLLAAFAASALVIGAMAIRDNAAASSHVLEIDTERDITINGIAAGDQAGSGVAVGDLNNDQVNDLVVGAVMADPGGRSDAGETYVIFGPLGPGTVELSSADITFRGVNAGDWSGRSVAVGDINDDGADDLVIGAPRADPSGINAAGESYVIFGPLAAGAFELSAVADLTINGVAARDRSGSGVAIGDANNDGRDGLAIGAPLADPGGRDKAGQTYVMFGPLGPGTLDLSTSADVTVNGIAAGDASGSGVALGRVGHDGADDLIIGAHLASPGGRVQAGQTYVVFGPLSAGTLELSTAADISASGIAAGDRSGGGVASGDINNGGADDLIIGANRADPGGKANAGETYVLLGPLGIGALELSSAADVTYNGIDAGDWSGFSVAAGDVNNDGWEDLVIGGPLADPGTPKKGETYVIFGQPPTAFDPTPTPR